MMLVIFFSSAKMSVLHNFFFPSLLETDWIQWCWYNSFCKKNYGKYVICLCHKKILYSHMCEFLLHKHLILNGIFSAEVCILNLKHFPTWMMIADWQLKTEVRMTITWPDLFLNLVLYLFAHHHFISNLILGVK